MIKLIICGAAGRMGQAILSLALKDAKFSVTHLIEAPDNPMVGKNIQGIPVHINLAGAAKEGDVVIDFTNPASSIKNAVMVAAARRALVVGTTGLVGAERRRFLKAVKPIPTVFSPNMSMGANVVFDVAERLAKLLPSYDAEITEIHHNLKKDAPSGTAQRLAEAVSRGRGGMAQFTYGRRGMVGQRKSSEIGIHALRGGDVVGDHTVFFMGAGERIELSHRAATRDAFAAGALAAAKWIVKKRPGLYDMSDVLGLKK